MHPRNMYPYEEVASLTCLKAMERCNETSSNEKPSKHISEGCVRTEVEAFANSVKTSKNLYICIFIASYFELYIVFVFRFLKKFWFVVGLN